MMRRETPLSSHTFLAISFPDGSYHVGSSSHSFVPLESQSIHQAMKFHPEDEEWANDILTQLQTTHPNETDYQEASIDAYNMELQSATLPLTDEQQASLVESYYVLAYESFGSYYFLAEGKEQAFSFSDALRLKEEEALALTENLKKEERYHSDWEPMRYVLTKQTSKPEEEVIHQPLTNESEFVIQFSDEMYVAHTGFTNLRLETRYLDRAQRFQSKSDVSEKMREIKKDAKGHRVRSKPVVNELIFVPSLEGNQTPSIADAKELTKYYAIGKFGKTENKQYAGRHYATIFGEHAIKTIRSREEVDVQLDTFFYFDGYKYEEEIPKFALHEKQVTKKKAKKAVDALNQQSPGHQLVEITVWEKPTKIR